MGKWTNNVVKALENLGGQGTLEDIYKEFEAITKSLNQDFSDFKNYKGNPNWKATVRRELQQNASNEISYNPKLYQDLFFKLKKGVWGLKDNKTMVKNFVKNFHINLTLIIPNNQKTNNSKQ